MISPEPVLRPIMPSSPIPDFSGWCEADRKGRNILAVTFLGVILIISSAKLVGTQPSDDRSAVSVPSGTTAVPSNASIIAAQDVPKESSFLPKLLEKHPSCAVWFQDPSLGQQATTRFMVNRYGQYIREKEEHVYPRYDHQSCFLMKSRYNCAKGSDQRIPEAAYWKLVLRDPKNNGTITSNRYCDLASFVGDMGGPSGLLHLLGKSDSSLTILLEGHSLMRQVFEALVCGFRDHLMNLRLVFGGPQLSLGELAKHDKNPVQVEELGEIRDWSRPSDWMVGCHGGSSFYISQFYGPNVTVPPTVPNCSDNVAMAEFAGNVKVSYFNRPSQYAKKATEKIYHDLLGWSLDVDSSTLPKLAEHVLWRNNKQTYARNQLLDSDQLLHDEDTKFLKDALQKIQKRHAGRFWGADNVGMHKVPDFHPCMPGMPDDEVNVLLFSFLVTQYWKAAKVVGR